jgi:hypothetical protein
MTARGRQPYTDAEREAAKKSKRRRMFALDANLAETLHTAAASMESELGFKPTMSQVIRHLIKPRKETP